MSIKIIYIDDDNRELEKYELKFKSDDRSINRFKLIARKPPKSPKDYEEIRKESPELILIDFNLTIPDADGKVIGISGVTLSTEMRQQFPEIPIVLFTRKSIFNIQDYSNIKQTLSNIDKIIYKNELFSPNALFLETLYVLSIGYKKLRESKSKNQDDLLKLLKAPENEHENLKLANPPMSSATKSIWSVSEIAKWINEILITYPGILYDSIHSATYLGITEEAFLTTEVQQFFNKAKYLGIFTPPENRWWKSKLLEIATSKMNKSESSFQIREGFPSAWKRINKNPIENSKCIYSGDPPAEWVCYILNKPVMIKYSLSYRPDSRPSVMDEARVSFEAIRTSNQINDNLFDPLGREMLEQIRKMPKRGR